MLVWGGNCCAQHSPCPGEGLGRAQSQQPHSGPGTNLLHPVELQHPSNSDSKGLPRLLELAVTQKSIKALCTHPFPQPCTWGCTGWEMRWEMLQELCCGSRERNPLCCQSSLPAQVQINCPSLFWSTACGNLLMAAWEIKSRFLQHYLFQQQWQQAPPFSCFCFRCCALPTHKVIQRPQIRHFIFSSLVMLCYSLKTSAQFFRLLSEFLSLCQMLKDWFRHSASIRCG